MTYCNGFHTGKRSQWAIQRFKSMESWFTGRFLHKLCHYKNLLRRWHKPFYIFDYSTSPLQGGIAVVQGWVWQFSFPAANFKCAGSAGSGLHIARLQGWHLQHSDFNLRCSERLVKMFKDVHSFGRLNWHMNRLHTAGIDVKNVILVVNFKARLIRTSSWCTA